VALVSPIWTIWQHRLLSGALRYADSHPRIIVRVFAPFQDARSAAREVEIWGANGVLGVLEALDLKEFLEHLRRPLPLANSALGGDAAGVVTVVGDFPAFARTAIDHLRQMGLRTIGLALLDEGPQHREKLVRPFLELLRSADPAANSVIHTADRQLLWDPEASVTPVPSPIADWLRALRKPAGVVCPQQGGGGYLIRCCRALGLRVPEDVAILGADETDLSLACDPTLTSVVLSMETVGAEAMRVVCGMMKGTTPSTSIIRVQAMHLTVRESTGAIRPEICDISGAMECIRSNATRGLTVEQLMQQTQRVSRVTFHKRFLEVVGKTPAEAIRDRKLEEARRLLSGTELPIDMVSDLCGFSSARVMARVFRSVEQTAPRDYRRVQQAGARPKTPR
jgi:LacI family transcriptional regulator